VLPPPREQAPIYESLFGVERVAISKAPPLTAESDTRPEDTEPRQGFADADITSDDDLLLYMVGGDINGEDILALWRGDTSDYDNDHSRADLALLRHLAFWTNYNEERIDRLFRQSGLSRQKWEREDYRRMSLGKALR
jgi:hypothetical protein